MPSHVSLSKFRKFRKITYVTGKRSDNFHVGRMYLHRVQRAAIKSVARVQSGIQKF